MRSDIGTAMQKIELRLVKKTKKEKTKKD